MPPTSPGPAATYLAGKLAEVSPAERELLMLLSVLYVPTPVTVILETLKRCRGNSTRALPSLAETRDMLARLERLGLVTVKVLQYACLRDVVEPLTRLAVSEGCFEGLAQALPPRPALRRPGTYMNGPEKHGPLHVFRDLRVAFHRGSKEAVARLLLSPHADWLGYLGFDPFAQLLLEPFDAVWCEGLPAPVRDVGVNAVLMACRGLEVGRGIVTEQDLQACDLEPFYDWVAPRLLKGLHQLDPLATLTLLDLSWRAVLHGDLELAEQLAELSDLPDGLAIRGFLAMARGNAEEAVSLYQRGLAALRARLKSKKACFDEAYGLLYIPALMACQRLDEADKLASQLASDRKHPLQSSYKLLHWAVCTARGLAIPVPQPSGEDLECPHAYYVLLFAAASYWHDAKDATRLVESLEQVLEAWSDTESIAAISSQGKGRAQTGLPSKPTGWLEAEVCELLGRLTHDEAWARRAATRHARMGTRTFLDLIETREPWKRTLQALLEVGASAAAAPRTLPASQKRLVWHVRSHEHAGQTTMALHPLEQVHGAKGWSAGRAVSLKRLHDEHARLDFLTAADRGICACIASYRDQGYYPTIGYRLDSTAALRHLIGHPHLYSASTPPQRVEVLGARPALRVERSKTHLTLRLDPPAPPQGDTLLIKGSDRSFTVVQLSASDRRLAELLGTGLIVPLHAEAQVREAVEHLAGSIAVHSDGVVASVETVDADGRLYANLSPVAHGLRAQVRVHPLGTVGPAFLPGEGPVTVLAEIEGRSKQARRALRAELAALEALHESVAGTTHGGLLECPEAIEALELLDALAPLAEQGQVLLQWPEGAPLRLLRRLEVKDLHVRLQAEREWFRVGGEVAVDEGRVLALEELLQQQRQGRFVDLGQGRFVALSDELRRRVDELEALGDRDKKGLKVHPLALGQVEESMQGATLATDTTARAQLQRLTTTVDVGMPSTLQAELRDYQVEGVRWLARLAGWGAGACLADDMGLGKTLQTLALLLLRAGEGPALVVAPTSVCSGWVAEARRFAPTLRLKLYAGANRALGSPGPYDVVVTSYALLTQDEAALAELAWATVVLDEAQAIKNATTQRSRAVHKLQAGFRIAVTGTPVENHLGELYNLFRFINPGLLGSQERFNAQLAGPIERGDREARKRLKRRISPFVLRRTKAQVLDELPARTEITLHVELSAAERELYEALRRQALKSIEGLGDESAAAPSRGRRGAASSTGQAEAQRRVQILAELMRLRRACCHPSLVAESSPEGSVKARGTSKGPPQASPQAAVSSSKLDAFCELLDELVANHHKVLVFSQFVDHLTLVRQRLDARGLPYQYLDGATPMKERDRRVAAFQRGEGDAFLISLRAGGTGLNLTAADYVIHLDPWWNPAVEDQASDRAHRMGQTRPVTIFRLVTRDTVEERIVALHRSKRDLADSLLEGAEAAARLSADDLMQLLALSPEA